MNFIVYYIVPFALVLGILILFHELGHFLVAKAFSVKILKFSLGFGPKLAGKKLGETEYQISAIPLGGYVKMLGENDEDEEDRPLSPEEERRSFSHQHVLKRLAIVLAGPFFNLFLALVIFCGFYMAAGKHVMIPQVGEVRDASPAHRAGILKGDIIDAIDGRHIETWLDIRESVRDNAGTPLHITILRGGKFLTLTVVPEPQVVKNIFGEERKSALIGIVASGKFRTVNLGLAEALGEGFRRTWELIKMTALVVVKLLEGVLSIKTLGGPILIGQMTGEVAQQNWAYLFPLMGVISVNLGILNLLPVPILDGGFVVFLLIELIIGRPLGIRKREMAQKAGLVLLMMLMAVVMYNDVARLLK
ncbi:MAG: RIP metalloprotease RseP [Deltaproteobacteria bacterium]|nr:MAG: RIP metalloprotease RseP [Deltaproteobacteria bacterium]